MVKLRQSHTSDIEQVRKAVRAAIVLIPLLGITNILNMTEAPLHRTAIEFALWSYTTHFLTSFQGLFIATIYCFLNNEVNNNMPTIALVPGILFVFIYLGASCFDEESRCIHVIAWKFRLDP